MFYREKVPCPHYHEMLAQVLHTESCHKAPIANADILDKLFCKFKLCQEDKD